MMTDCWENWLWFAFGAAAMWAGTALVLLILWGIDLGRGKVTR